MKVKIVLSLLLAVVLVQEVCSQTKELSPIQRFEVNVGYAYMPQNSPAHNIALGVEYRFYNFLAPSIHYKRGLEFDSSEYADNTNFLKVGCKFYILPLFMPQKRYCRVDLYVEPGWELWHRDGYNDVSTELGSASEWEAYSFIENYFAMGAGFVYYPWKHIGLFGEYNWYWVYEGVSNRYVMGINVRF